MTFKNDIVSPNNKLSILGRTDINAEYDFILQECSSPISGYQKRVLMYNHIRSGHCSMQKIDFLCWSPFHLYIMISLHFYLKKYPFYRETWPLWMKLHVFKKYQFSYCRE